MKVVALDYGSARTGVAVSDASGTLARPLTIVEQVNTEAGLSALCDVLATENAALVVVGMPYTLRGERGPQALETERFVDRLRTRCLIPIRTEDERFTTAIAQTQLSGRAARRGNRRRSASASPASGDDAQAAAVLLQGFLDRRAVADDDGSSGRSLLSDY